MKSATVTHVPEGRSFLAWVGGKSLLTEQIIALSPPHTCYVEVFAGASWLLFKKSESPSEIINDVNTDLITLYRVIKFHLDEFVKEFRWLLVHREEFERQKKVPPDTLTDIQRAARFYYLLKLSFGAKLTNQCFGVTTTGKPRLNLLRIEEELSDAHLRLSRVTIERQTYANCIRKFDRAHTWFYIDPPYYKCEEYYGKGIFERGDFERLAIQLSTIKGKFALSINDHPVIRETFKAFKVTEVQTRYSVASKKSPISKPVIELIYTNY